jgi:uracil-DNA glycosylase
MYRLGVARFTVSRTAVPLERHVSELLACKQCPEMHKPVVSGGPVVSKIILVGQAPGDKEPLLKRPFAWTAGKTLFRWFEESSGISEANFRSSIYMAAVCRCFPGKKATGGDRVPSDEEIANCSGWLEREIRLLRPELIIPVGKLAIAQFIPATRLDQVIGRKFKGALAGRQFDLIPLPHPSGASPWHRMEPGKTLLARALASIKNHPAFREILRGLEAATDNPVGI